MVERALMFECEGEQLLGVITLPQRSASLGVVIATGGPQYRAGSHRQFVLLARRLAGEGYAVLRFDYRGMGDSTGAVRPFEDTASDIRAAVDAFQRACPELRHIVLWGLCDAASACLLYWNAAADPRVAGMVLLNPWVRSTETFARTHIKHYYAKRMVDPEFWSKLAKGGVNVVHTCREFVSTALTAARGRRTKRAADRPPFQERMAAALRGFGKPVLIILSGQDLTAKEFCEYLASSASWRGLLDQNTVQRIDIADADHTFSTAKLREEVEARTIAWLRSWGEAKPR
jgi:exosortase A-associated hydrolase 1